MKLFVALTAALFLTSCSTVGPITATSNPVGSQKGESCRANILGIIPISGTDTSIYKAAREGGVKKIATVDYEGFFAGIYNSYCTVVHGSK
jgi:hypothetical protein